MALIGLVVPALRWLYNYAWFVGFAVSAVVYVALMRGHSTKALPEESRSARWTSYGAGRAASAADRHEALVEANRCLYCYDAPCTHACPTHIDIPRFIKKIATDNLPGSARTILESNLLGATCARVCPVQELCEGACVLGHGA